MALTLRSDGVAPLVAHFDAIRGALPGQDLAWLGDLRTEALAQFTAAGVPGAKVEEWKYSAVARALSGDAPAGEGRRTAAPAVDAAMVRAQIDDYDGPSLVFVDGIHQPQLSRVPVGQKGISIRPLSTVLAESPEDLRPFLAKSHDRAEHRLSGQVDRRPFALIALNAALMADGAAIKVAADTVCETRIYILHLNRHGDDQGMVTPRTVVACDSGAQCRIVESYVGVGDASYLTNAVTQIFVGSNGRVEHWRLQAECGAANHVGATLVDLGDGARYDATDVTIGGGANRAEMRVGLAGDHAQCHLKGLYLGRGRQQHDLLTRLDHVGQDCISDQVYKGVIGGNARGAFQGKIHVAPNALKTDAKLLNKNLIVSDAGEADSKPELEILADDVKCAHGSTVGDLDLDALFYLRARGIDEAAARALLINGFVADVLDGAGDETVAGQMRRAVNQWLAGEVQS